MSDYKPKSHEISSVIKHMKIYRRVWFSPTIQDLHQKLKDMDVYPDSMMDRVAIWLHYSNIYPEISFEDAWDRWDNDFQLMEKLLAENKISRDGLPPQLIANNPIKEKPSNKPILCIELYNLDGTKIHLNLRGKRVYFAPRS